MLIIIFIELKIEIKYYKITMNNISTHLFYDLSDNLFTKITWFVALILLCSTFSCQQQSVQKQIGETITEEEAKILTESRMKIWNEGNLDLVNEIHTIDYVRHEIDIYDDRLGLNAFKKWVTFIRTAYPDYNRIVDEIIVKNNRIVIRWKMTGTNTGPRGEMSPTGKKVQLSGVSIFQVVNGKIAEEWVFYNQEAISRQLGYPVASPY